jgi:pyrroline-5-carboxylate reductase
MQNKLNSPLKVAFIGGGNMASALIEPLVLGKIANVHVVDVKQENLDKLCHQFGVSFSLQIDDELRSMDVIVLAIKPQQMAQVCTQLKTYLNQQLVMSIAAGIPTSAIENNLDGYNKIVRAMPNTPAMIGLGMTGLFATPNVNLSQKKMAQLILQSVGECLWVEEELKIDAVTAVSGSGPAYVFYFIEAMETAAMSLGFTKEEAILLAKATFNGASQLAMESSDPVNILRERVTSKGGTTYAALCSLEKDQVASSIGKAIQAAAQRAHELGQEFGQITK